MLTKFLKAGFGSVGAQVINLAALPVIARLYEPEEYAVWAIVIATAMIFGGIASLRYEVAIVLPERQEDASAVFIWCVLCSLSAGLLVAAGAALVSQTGYLEGGAEGNELLHTLFTPLLVTTLGLTLALQHWAVRLGRYALNSVSQLGLAVFTLLVQFSYAVLGDGGAMGLVIGSLAGQIAAVAILSVGCATKSARPELSVSAIRRLPEMIRDYYRFPLYSMPYVLFGTIRDRASVYVIALFLGTRDAGLYAFAYRIMNFPVSLVSAALRPVVFREATTGGVGALEDRINLILRWLVLLATPVLVVYFRWSDQIFAFVFGEEWRGAALYADFIALPVFTFMFCNWLDRILDVLGRQRLTLGMEIAFGSASIIALWVAFEWDFDLRVALAAQCAILIAYNLAYLVAAYDCAGYRKTPLLHHAGLVLLVAAVLGPPVWMF
ncbi:MAG: lipopolysaccharide biosynthesis protein [Pseudomonadales bacterium]|nr:lipopolysaccharide biosynthesis protein [Pseudomonadales bacterium]